MKPLNYARLRLYGTLEMGKVKSQKLGQLLSIIFATDEENKGEEPVRTAEAALAHPDPVIVRFRVFRRFDDGTDWSRSGSRCSSESLKAEVNPAVAHAVEHEKVVDMLDLGVLACWHHRFECFALNNRAAVYSVVMILS
ncbi:hypothetical protein IFM58399_01296 [Aspergillus lentulus]|uniref:Uncharacterized protein n=1 Tax=Aspergillus lentulus TaxID=293939 RepID=A0ABQ0ZVH3_ASPLE|nr:uncharacterized protein IFM58399_01296 [Aspergillus lentulus]GFF26110.1 hypothetical protein IFM58399_01296 [Aspergillus lentulus]GFF62295.1 hypothetical protein IFM60648_00584 [Aspergillus lentulus]